MSTGCVESKLSKYSELVLRLVGCSNEEVYDIIVKMKSLDIGVSYGFINEVLKERSTLSKVELFKISTLVSEASHLNIPSFLKKIHHCKYDRYLFGMMLGLETENITDPVFKFSFDEYVDYLKKKKSETSFIYFGSAGLYVLVKLGVAPGLQKYDELDVLVVDELFNHFIVKVI